MFDFFKKIDTKVLVLYKFDSNQTIDKIEFDKYPLILSECFNVSDSFMSFSDINYKEYNCQNFSTSYTLMSNKFHELASFIIYNTKPINSVPSFQIYVGKSLSPSILIFQFPNNLNNAINEVINSLINHFQPLYGFSYETIKHQRSCSYALFGYSDELPKISGIGRKGIDRERYTKNISTLKEGKIRDIYRENILSSIQLKYNVNGITLQELIGKENLGALRPINSNLFIWELDKNDLQIARDILYKTEIFI